jgi:beta-glucosidase
MLKKLLIGFAALIILLILATGALVLKASNYDRYDVKADRSLFAEVQTESDVAALAERLVTEMTLEEKLQQMWGERPFGGYLKFIVSFFLKDEFPYIFVGRNERLNIPPWVLSDGPRGAVVGKGNTSFPVAMARGASWDVALERRVADVIGKEVRANGTNYNSAPCINVLMHPAWGRAQETYGEDPWLLGEFAVAYTQSVQQHNVMACPKHFALNNIENSRFYVNVDLDERTLREVYLPHFKKVIQEGKAASVMSAYNQFRGDYVSHSRYLLTDILRDEWGFEGFVTSDWINALRDGVKGVKAGMDIEMPFRNHYGDELEDAIRNGEVTEEEIDEIVLRILKTRLQYAFADDKMTYDKSIKASAEHTALAQEVAEKSMVLLKNEEILPFAQPGGKKVAVLGAIANRPNTGDKGSSNVRAPYVVTPFAGLAAYAQALGGEALLYDGDDLEEAKATARRADQVVLVVGFTHEDEGEYIVMSTDPPENVKEKVQNTVGGDRATLALKPRDVAMIKAAREANPNVVVVIVAGSAVTMADWQSDAPAILYGWYAGMEGGHALARVLYGDVNPSGKLPFTIPQSETQLPLFDSWATEARYGYYHGYTLFDKENKKAAFPFGFGLSYTTFAYDEIITEKETYAMNDTLTVRATLRNTGKRSGEEVAQLYIGFGNSSIDRPVKLLRGFKKVQLDPGESTTVTFRLPVQDLAWYNPEAKAWEVEAMTYEYFIGGSSSMNSLKEGSFTVEQ